MLSLFSLFGLCVSRFIPTTNEKARSGQRVCDFFNTVSEQYGGDCRRRRSADPDRPSVLSRGTRVLDVPAPFRRTAETISAAHGHRGDERAPSRAGFVGV